MRTIETIINGPCQIEAGLDLPDSTGLFPGVALCHPHPLYGGNMFNNVILACSHALTAKGIACLRFNFRGVGRSQGSFSDGIGEQDDAWTALSFLQEREEINPALIGIAGYSFGGMIALSVSEWGDLVKAIAVVSPIIPPGILSECTKPKFIITGAEDNMIPASTILNGASGMADPKTVEVVPGVDHFWQGHEEKAANAVADFFAGVIFLGSGLTN